MNRFERPEATGDLGKEAFLELYQSAVEAFEDKEYEQAVGRFEELFVCAQNIADDATRAEALAQIDALAEKMKEAGIMETE
jgi:hypothetical protein